MGTKKSKGQAAMGSQVTYMEKKKHSQGTTVTRFGVDSQLPFGYCALTVSPVVEPVATPSGHMYSREAIFEYLLTKNKDLRRQQALYDAQEASRAEAVESEYASEFNAQAQKFVSSQLVLHDPSSSSSSSSTTTNGGVKRKMDQLALIKDDDERKKALVKSIGSKIGDKVTRDELKSSSFWVPSFAPEHVHEKVKAPPKRPPSPNSEQPLRLKDLFPINLQVDVDCLNENDKKYICAVSGKQITFQNVILLKKANAVILESIYNDLVKPSMICPLTGGKLKEKDILRLVKPGSSFAGGGQVEASKYAHTIT